MTAVWVLLMTFLLAQSTFSARVLPKPSQQHHVFTELVKLNPDANRVGIDKCELCVEFANQAIDALLQFVLQVGVVDTCEDLCQVFADKTGSQALGIVCNILCDVVGIKEFVNIIQREDLDPIYYCELIPVCPVNDHGDAKFTSFDVSPKKGPQGTFNIAFEYVSVNGTGTGELDIECLTVDGIPLSQSFLHESAPAGRYDGSFQLNAVPDPDCDPTQGPCESWQPGNYTLKLAICNGECGSKHPHSQIYDEAVTYFEITDDSRHH